ncbi:MAG TPA: tripartite tricarboxylate transporter permease [Chloroflexota bacterium]
MFDYLALGFQTAFEPGMLLYTTLGVLAGIIIGLIPGLTITMGVILVLPFTYGMQPAEGLTTMMGVWVGGASGGLISSCLLGIPGKPSAVATTFDGFPMARNGEPGRALGLGTWASLFGGIFGWFFLATLTPILADIGLKFGPWEFFALIAFSITIIASLSGESLVKGLISGLLGMLLATVGLDPMLSIPRFTFGMPDLYPGFDFLTVLIGLFAFSQLLTDLEKTRNPEQVERIENPDTRIPTIRVLKDIWNNKVGMIWASLVGLWIGIVPAAGGAVANVLAYDQAKKVSKHPEKFGTGYHEGIIASEAGNNSVSAGDLVPTLALGIPGDAVTAVMLGALLIHGLNPGPLLMSTQPRLAYGLICAYLIATVLTLVIQLGLMRVLVKLVMLPKDVLMPGILVMCALGAFVLNNRIFDIWGLFGFGLIGYFLVKHDFDLPPFVLGFLLEPIAEINLKRALQTNSDLSQFLTRPMSGVFILLAVLSVVYYFYVGWKHTRQEAAAPTPSQSAP